MKAPTIPKEQRQGLTLVQIRILDLLAKSRGCLTRARIAERIGAKAATSSVWAIGYSDPVKRAKFRLKEDGIRNGVPLLDLGYVTEIEIDVDGREENTISITDKGREVLDLIGKVRLGPLRDGWAKVKGRLPIEDENSDESDCGGEGTSDPDSFAREAVKVF